MTHLKSYTIHRSPIPLAGDTDAIVTSAFRHEDQDREHLMVFATDFVGNIIGYKRVGTGLRSRVKTSIRDVLQAAIVLGAEKFWLSHNHPNGTTQLSIDDLNLTMEVFRAARLCGMGLKGHLLFTEQAIVTYHMHEVEDKFNQLIAAETKPTEVPDNWTYDNKYLKGALFRVGDKVNVTLRFKTKNLASAYRHIREFKRLYVGPEKG